MRGSEPKVGAHSGVGAVLGRLGSEKPKKEGAVSALPRHAAATAHYCAAAIRHTTYR